MKIAVCDLQPANWPVGGQQIELASYAVAFELLGHEADLYFNDDSEPLWPELAERAHLMPHMQIKPLGDIWKHYRVYDFLLSGYPWISLPKDAPVVSWWIDPYVVPGGLFGKDKWPLPWEAYPNLIDIWTLSETMRDGLLRHRRVPGQWRDIAVFYAPLGYSRFREAARPWAERDIDLLFVGRDSAGKHPEVFVEMVEQLGAEDRAAMLLSEWSPRETNPQLKSKLQALPFYAVVHATRDQVADYMGRAKVFFLPSREECAPLTVYEALNAGCYVVATNVGSVAEQVGSVGALFAYGDWQRARSQIEFALAGKEPVTPTKRIISRGRRFDRAETLPKLAQRLESSVMVGLSNF